MLPTAERKSRAHRRFFRELSRVFDRWGGDCAETRDAVTRAALRQIFDHLLTSREQKDFPRYQGGGGGGFLSPSPSSLRPVETVATGFRKDVGELLERWERIAADADALDADVLGYVFEQSLARKRLGAYFTAPDVAAYICRSTLLPRLFEMVGGLPDLRQLQGREGVARYLPAYLPQVELLPLESRYEQQRRQSRLQDTLAAWTDGQIATVNDCLTWNLDLTQIARDCIERGPDPGSVLRWQTALDSMRVLDPTCGSGDFLLAAYDLLARLGEACARRLGCAPGALPLDPLRSLYGVDLLPGAVEVARMRLYLRAMRHDGRDVAPRLVDADFLNGGPTAPGPFRDAEGEALRFDAVIGNPPYVSCADERERYHRLGYETTAGGNLYTLVMERSLAILAEGGRLGMIVPINSVSGPEFRPLVTRLTRGTCWVSTYSNRPAKLFEGVEQRLAIWMTAPDAPAACYVSPYQHWWREERAFLFERLRYCKTALGSGYLMPAKTGCPTAERILGRMRAQQGCLGDLVCPGDDAVWLHDGPTYWVRALPFRPNEDRRPKRSSHYHRLSVPDAPTARVLAAVLNSTTFYLHYKWTSNCRDLGHKDWAGFPLDPLPTTLQTELAECGLRLAETLRATAARRTRVYPSGSVTYEEYYPARAKEILDEIDRLLAGHYGFGDEELEYILNYDLKYRMGRDDAEHDEH